MERRTSSESGISLEGSSITNFVVCNSSEDWPVGSALVSSVASSSMSKSNLNICKIQRHEDDRKERSVQHSRSGVIVFLCTKNIYKSS